METSSYSKYQLWSPPVLDLSLGSFSNDIISEFDKTRSNISNMNDTTSIVTDNKDEETHDQQQASNDDALPKNNHEEQELTTEYLEVKDKHNSIIFSSSLTLPNSEPEASEEDASSTANLFRKSSTFLKKKWSVNSKKEQQQDNNNANTVSNLSSTNAEEIISIISRQYPPKPLQYSPVVESEDENTIPTAAIAFIPVAPVTNTNASRKSRDIVELSAQKTIYDHVITVSPAINTAIIPSVPKQPVSVDLITATTVATTTTPTKRRSFFSWRFC